MRNITLFLFVGLAACSNNDNTQPTTQDAKAACKQYASELKQCFDSIHQPVTVNPSYCDTLDGGAAENASFVCAAAHPNALCSQVKATYDAGTFNPKDPEVVAFNECLAEKSTVSPCSDAVHAIFQQCGVVYFFTSCNPQQAAYAQCYVKYPADLCTQFDAGAPSKAYRDCLQAAATVDAGADAH
jgi:hypothetical protein